MTKGFGQLFVAQTLIKKTLSHSAAEIRIIMIGSIIGDVVGNAGAVSNIKETRVMEATIGINQRIPIEAIELAIKAVMNGSYDNDYAAELARMEYSGENRIKKAVNIINWLTKNKQHIDVFPTGKQEQGNVSS